MRLLIVGTCLFAVAIAACRGRDAKDCGPTNILLTSGAMHMWSDASGDGIELHDDTTAREAVRKATKDGCSTMVRISAAEDVRYADLVAVIDVSLAAGRKVAVVLGGEVEVQVAPRPDAAAIARAPHVSLGEKTVSLDGAAIASPTSPEFVSLLEEALAQRVQGERFVVIEAGRRASISEIKQIAHAARDATFAVLFVTA